MLEEVRWIKTPSEIQLLKEAAVLLDEVYLEVLPTIRPGEQEREVHARMMRGCIEKGFSWAHGILNSHRNEIMYNGESSFRIAAGDMIRTDYVVGPWFHQQEPILRRGSELKLAENMVLALEPYYGSYHIQDVIHESKATG
jgi:Xaa-Pro aminopeptidase